VRLDHLLSKEHWQPAPGRHSLVGAGKGVQVALSRPSVSWGLLTGGTSISWRRHSCAGSPVQASPLGVVVERGRCGVWSVPGTLLGPEGSDRDGSVFLVGPGPGFIPHPVGCGWPLGVGCRLYVENYTVDASIFVAKFLRAHGGCLGTRNR
jgi:hypothetical protein